MLLVSSALIYSCFAAFNCNIYFTDSTSNQMPVFLIANRKFFPLFVSSLSLSFPYGLKLYPTINMQHLAEELTVY